MDEKRKKSALILLLVVVFIVGAVFFYEEDRTEDEETEETDEVSITGNLACREDDDERRWYLRQKEGDDDSMTRLVIGEDICKKDNQECLYFLEKECRLSGNKIEVVGKREDGFLKISDIDFLDDFDCSFEFSDFSTQEEYEIENVFVNFETRPQAEEFRTRIKETAEEGPNFAGKFSYAEWGCGTYCGAGSITDLTTGEIVEFGLINSHGVNFEKGSRLLIIDPPEKLDYIQEGDLLENIKSEYYLINEEGELFLLCRH